MVYCFWPHRAYPHYLADIIIQWETQTYPLEPSFLRWLNSEFDVVKYLCYIIYDFHTPPFSSTLGVVAAMCSFFLAHVSDFFSFRCLRCLRRFHESSSRLWNSDSKLILWRVALMVLLIIIIYSKWGLIFKPLRFFILAINDSITVRWWPLL